MLNEPPPEPNKPLHPLERRAKEAAGQEAQPRPPQQSQRGLLHIRIVKPRVTQALVALNVIIFAIMFYVLSDVQIRDWYRFGANSHLAVFGEGEYYRLLTSMFLHADLQHLAFNMLALYFIGQTVEQFFGHWRFLLVYLLGGLTGSLLSATLHGNSVTAVGASGAVFAIIGGEIIFLYNHRKLFRATAVHQLRRLIFISAANLIYGFIANLGPTGVRIDNLGHLGGFAGGLALAYILGPIFVLKRREGTETEFEAVDIQPLEHRYQNVMAYFSGMLIVTILATVAVRGI